MGRVRWRDGEGKGREKGVRFGKFDGYCNAKKLYTPVY